MMKLVAFAGGRALLMTGCVISIDGDHDPDLATHFSHDVDELGTVYGADFSRDALTVTVSDNGCTTKEFFRVRVDREDEDAFDVALERTRRDYCKVNNPDGVALTWTYAELGVPDGAEVALLNRVKR